MMPHATTAIDSTVSADPWMTSPPHRNLVSIVLPTHNRAALLPDALRSIANQSYRPLELLIVDDGSQDQTPSAIESWQESLVDDPDLDIVVQKQANLGAPAARNAGLQGSRGEFIQFMDSDDALLPQKIAWQVDCLRRYPALDYVWSDTQLVRHDRFSQRVMDLSRAHQNASCPRATQRGLERVPSNAVSGLFRRDLCRRIGPWSETLKRHQDWEYMLRILHDQPEVRFLPAILYVVRLHSEGRISDLGKRHRRSIRMRIDAAEAAERYAARHVMSGAICSTYRRRLATRYWKVLRDSLVSLAWPEIPNALAGIGRSYCRSHGRSFAK